MNLWSLVILGRLKDINKVKKITIRYHKQMKTVTTWYMYFRVVFGTYNMNYVYTYVQDTSGCSGPELSDWCGWDI